MTPAARTQAAIELVDAIVLAAREGGAAADTLVQRYFATRRYAGAKDRRAVRELVFAAIRACGPVPPSGRAAMLRLADTDFAVAASFDGSAHGPAPIDPREPRAEGGLAPAWLTERLAVSEVAGTGLLDRAPFDLRVNPARADLAAVRAVLPEAEPIAGTRHGLRVPAGTRVEALPVWQAGGIEVQDAGSQLVADAVAARAGETVIDLCAGGGGKTLALAADMAGEGVLLATDTDRARCRSWHRAPRGPGSRWRRCCSTPAARTRRWPAGGRAPTPCWSTRRARAPAPGGATRRRAGG